MNIDERLSVSFYKTVTDLNTNHGVDLVRHIQTGKIAVRKTMRIYNILVFRRLMASPIKGCPKILALSEEDGVLTVIEEYISGTLLSDRIAGRTMTRDQIRSIMLDLCNILKQLHNMTPPIIHRDIKPSNIILTPYDHAVLLDFNAAKEFSECEEDTRLLGTAGYAAPEQYGFGASSPQTDIYALGVLLQEMTNAMPVKTNIFDRIIRRCRALDPNARFSSVSELEKQLLRISSESRKVNDTVQSILRFLPPGFRTLNPLHMLASIPIYCLLFAFSLAAEAQGTPAFTNGVLKFGLLTAGLMIIFFSCNYLEIQRFFPLCRSRKKLVKFLGILLFNICIVILMLIIAITLVMFFEK